MVNEFIQNEVFVSHNCQPGAHELVELSRSYAAHMNDENPTLREHLRRAGSVRSERKAAAVRENGRKGGRPRKR